MSFVFRLKVPRRTGNQNGATSNLPLLDHLEHNSGGFPCLSLANKALRGCSRL